MPERNAGLDLTVDDRCVLRGVGGRGGDRAAQRLEVAGEDPQQGGLAGAVGSHHAHDVARGDGEVEPLEQGAVRVAPGEVLGDEVGAHRASVVRGAVPPGRASVRRDRSRRGGYLPPMKLMRTAAMIGIAKKVYDEAQKPENQAKIRDGLSKLSKNVRPR